MSTDSQNALFQSKIIKISIKKIKKLRIKIKEILYYAIIYDTSLRARNIKYLEDIDFQ